MFSVKTILCPLDFSEPSEQTFKVAVELASVFSARLFLVNVVPELPALPPDPNFVFEVPEYELTLSADADEKLHNLANQAASRGIAVDTTVGHGDAAKEIVRIAEDQSADLIVIATHGLTGLQHAVFGSVAEKVVRMAKCPVLSIRLQQEGRESEKASVNEAQTEISRR